MYLPSPGFSRRLTQQWQPWLSLFNNYNNHIPSSLFRSLSPLFLPFSVSRSVFIFFYLLEGLSSGNRVVYRNSQSFESLSSVGVFHIRYFKTSAVHRDEVVTINTPPFSESITEGDVRWEKAVGDSVKEDEVVCEIETDKTSLQVPSPAAGVITELLVPDGGRVEAGNPLFKLKKGAAAAASVPAAEAPAPTPAAPTPGAPTPAAIPVAMPAVPPVPAQAAQAKPVSAVKPSAAPAELAAAHGARTESRVKMNRMRLRIAQRLKEAQQTCAMLTTFNEIDMRY
uniref:Lipoyl-binding domain-containing protein n=1 Tax=Hucho hucho TaxID=62062 RepID=A0A4W5N8H4_9TELE